MSAQSKILHANPTELELQVAQAFLDIEAHIPELKADLRPLQFKSIREVSTDYRDEKRRKDSKIVKEGYGVIYREEKRKRCLNE